MAKQKRKNRSNSQPRSAAIENREWEAQEDLRTLKRADEVRRDPSRLAAVEAQLKKEQQAIDSLRKGIGRKK